MKHHWYILIFSRPGLLAISIFVALNLPDDEDGFFEKSVMSRRYFGDGGARVETVLLTEFVLFGFFLFFGFLDDGFVEDRDESMSESVDFGEIRSYIDWGHYGGDRCQVSWHHHRPGDEYLYF